MNACGFEDHDDRGCDEQSVVSDEIRKRLGDVVHDGLQCSLLDFLGAGRFRAKVTMRRGLLVPCEHLTPPRALARLTHA
jgi:hypothetical protein